MLAIREKFTEILDHLKKQKVIKSSLELIVYTAEESEMGMLAQWLIVSQVKNQRPNSESLGDFVLENGERFEIYRAEKQRCERCWQFVADESDVCSRCANVLKIKVF